MYLICNYAVKNIDVISDDNIVFILIDANALNFLYMIIEQILDCHIIRIKLGKVLAEAT